LPNLLHMFFYLLNEGGSPKEKLNLNQTWEENFQQLKND